MKNKKDEIQILRCEHPGCKEQLRPGKWEKGWYQCGKSRFGDKYDPDGIASWCPRHEQGKGEK